MVFLRNYAHLRVSLASQKSVVLGGVRRMGVVCSEKRKYERIFRAPLEAVIMLRRHRIPEHKRASSTL